MAYVFYESGLSINVMYTIADGGKRAVGFKLSEGMDVPAELADTFKFARQKSKLAGTIRGSFFVIKGEHSTRTQCGRRIVMSVSLIVRYSIERIGGIGPWVTTAAR